MTSITKPSSGTPQWSSRPHAQVLPGTVSDANQRWARRRKSDVSGYINSDQLDAAVKCCMRDSSSSGAMLQLVPGNERVMVDDIPERFTLVFRINREYTQVKCLVVRRRGNCIGVRYEGLFSTTVKQPRAVAAATGKRR